MAIKHKRVVASGDKGMAADWNDEHEIDDDVDFAAHKGMNLADPTLDQDAATKIFVENYVELFFDPATGHDHDGVDSAPLNLAVYDPVIERYYSVAPPDWTTKNPYVDNCAIMEWGFYALTPPALRPLAPLHLPNGAVITKAIVWANVSNKTWVLYRITLATGANVELKWGLLNTEKTGINEVVDNSTYAYFFKIGNDLDNGDILRGGRITYTINRTYMS